MCKVLGIGIDLCEIARMEPLLADDRFLARYFTQEEAAYIRGRGQCAAQSMAGIFAAKEALLKALGRGLALPMHDIGVTHTADGAPQYTLTGRAAECLQGGNAMLSITHEDGMAAAVCVWQSK